MTLEARTRVDLSSDDFLYSEKYSLDFEKRNAESNIFETFGRAVVSTLNDPGANYSRHPAGLNASDVHMVSRRAEDAAARRFLAVAWLQTVLGTLGIPDNPSEEELRLCLKSGLVLCNLMNKLHPSAISKVVESSASLTPDNGTHSELQHFENIRNFLVAVEELKLPSFEASTLEKGALPTGSMMKVVDCILALKSYCDWRDNGAMKMWKYSDALKNSSKAFPQGLFGISSSMNIQSPSQTPHDTCLPVGTDVSRYHFDGMPLRHEGMGLKQSSEVTRNHLENIASNRLLSDLTPSWISHVGQEVSEVLEIKAKSLDSLQESNTINTAALYNLPALIRAVLRDKQPEEIPLLVEFLLRKVMEEFERQLEVQRIQLKKHRITLKELLSREGRLVYRIKALEALATGSGEEMKLISSQLQMIKVEKKHMEEEKILKEEVFKCLMKDRNETQMQVEILKEELESIKAESKVQKHRLEFQQKLEQMSQTAIKELSLELEKSELKVRNTQTALQLALQHQKSRRAEVYKILSMHSPAFEELKTLLYFTRQEAVQMKRGFQKEVITFQSQLQRLTAAATGYQKVLAENRMLYNEVQDLKGNIRVYCRVRPFLVGQNGGKSLVNFIGEDGEISIRNPSKQGRRSSKVFRFNKVYGASVSQEEIFQDACPLIRSVLDGYNVCIFAYGQTGSGKTYTMSGPTILSEELWGVNYRALNDLFQICQSRREVFSYEVGVQMIEIYNEQVRDLLVHETINKRLEIRNNSQLNGLNVPDASMMPVNSTDDVLELMRIGQKNRAVGATALNEHSSRSHSVLTVHVQGVDTASGIVLRGSLHLVDLAGSERVDKSEAVGERLREAQHINKSLSALGDVISALLQKSAHVPYRNSKLTQLLQESLGGQAKTLMFVHISQDDDSYGETISTLKFAERVASVELGAARANRESEEIRYLKEQVNFLQETLTKKEEEITKRDVEIERLQISNVGQRNSTEHFWGLDKPRSKAANSTLKSKPLEAQNHGSTPELVTIAEASQFSATRIRRRLFIEQSAYNLAAYTSEKGHPDTSPLMTEFATDRLEMPILSQSRNTSSDSKGPAKRSFVSLDQTKQKVHELMLDREANRKDWSDRIQMNQGAFFASPSSPDEECGYYDDDDDNVLKYDDESYDPQADPSSPMQSPSDSWKTFIQSSHPTGSSNFAKILRDGHLAEDIKARSSITCGDNSSQIMKDNMALAGVLPSHCFASPVLDPQGDVFGGLSRISERKSFVVAESALAVDNVDSQILPRKSKTIKRSHRKTQISQPPSHHQCELSDGEVPQVSSLRRQLSAVARLSRKGSFQ